MLSFIGIAALPPSVLFISEFLIVKTMFLNGKYILCAIFLILLTIIIYGMGKAVLSMSFSTPEKEAGELKSGVKLNWTMYIPQAVMLILSFVLGVCMPEPVFTLFANAVVGF